MLSEDAPQIGRAGLGAALSLLARPALQFFFAHVHPGGIGTDIEERRRLAPWQRLERFSLLPLLGRRPHPLHQALNLMVAHDDASGLAQVLFGLLVAGLIGSLQARQAG